MRVCRPRAGGPWFGTTTGLSGKTAAAPPNRGDPGALALVGGRLALAAVGGHQMAAPLASLDAPAVSLDPWNLPDYALRSTLRM
ncbi:hypothetical protein GAY28_28440, partial [Azospirillum brasilense]|nr:hypothetical protein [Azospirillum brasilense]